MRKSAGQMMASVLRDRKGVLLDFMEEVATINAESYCAALGRLRLASQRQRPGLLTTGILFLHDNVGTTRSPTTVAALQVDTSHVDDTAQIWPQVFTTSFRLIRISFWQPYSADLAPSDFHIRPTVKDYLSDHKFASDDNVKTTVAKWLKSQGTEFCETEINKPAPRLDKCHNLVRSVLKIKVVSIDNTCYLFLFKLVIYTLQYMCCKVIFGLPLVSL
jgi:hypothetical protein